MKHWGWLLRKDLRSHASVSEALAANRASRVNVEKKRPVSPWEYKTRQTYLDGLWVQKMESEGWEVYTCQPVIVAGSSIRQHIITMRRSNPEFTGAEEAKQ